MFSPLTKVLLKIFGIGFYRLHSGLMLFCFIGFASYCFYIQVLNQTHLLPEQIVPNNLLFVLTMISSPVMIILVALCCIVFSVKSFQFIATKIKEPANQFLSYSATSLAKSKQLQSWSIVQCFISLPILVYGLFSFTIGIFYHQIILPLLLLAFVISLAMVNAGLYVKLSNSFTHATYRSAIAQLFKRWPKPYWSLFLYHCFDTLKVPLTITKTISFLLLISNIYLTPGVENDLRLLTLFTLSIAIAHSMLIYHSFHFENRYLIFAKNLPISRVNVTIHWLITFSILMIPELLWIIIEFPYNTSIMLALFTTAVTALLRSFLFRNSNIKTFLYQVFYLFVLLFIIILFHGAWAIIGASVVITIWTIKTYYYKNHITP